MTTDDFTTAAREKCALCGLYYPVGDATPATDECHRSCWVDALNRMAEVGLTEKKEN